MESINLINYQGVERFKSVRRAIKRGHVTTMGFVVPKRPYSNRKPTLGRETNEYKKVLYERFKEGRIQ